MPTVNLLPHDLPAPPCVWLPMVVLLMLVVGNSTRLCAADLPYRGLSVEQHELALRTIKRVHSLEWDEAEKEAKKLQKLEKKEDLAPLSYLIMVSALAMRIQNGDFADRREENRLYKEVDHLAKKGLSLTKTKDGPDSLSWIRLFIQGGIKGFQATLKIQHNPLDALNDGLQALKLLETVLELDSTMKDAYLGSGILNCALAKAPFIARTALKVFGRSADPDTGLNHLRISAYQGCYTTAVARQFLIQFLSPYQGDLVKEKSEVFASLRSDYPRNPCFLFLQLDEEVCFEPESLYALSTREMIEENLAGFTSADRSSQRYVNLIKWQYWLVNPFPAPETAPDTAFDLGDLSFYPVFIRAANEKHLLVSQVDKVSADRAARILLIRKLGSAAQKMLRESGMHPSRRGFYAWHIRDALRTN